MKKQEVNAPVEATGKAKEKYEVIEETFDNLEFEQDELSGKYDEVFFVKPKTKDVAYFEFSKKIGDKIHQDPRTTIQTIDGNLAKIELGSYTYENKEIKTIKLHLTKTIKDKNILFIISSSYTQVARSIMNSLLGCQEAIEKLNITLYLNQSGYTSVKMSINGKKSEWYFSIDEQKKYIETLKNKKGEFVSNDYSDLDDLFTDKLREHLPIILPNQDHIKFIPEVDVNTVLGENNDVETFGEDDDDDASEFFEINEN